MKDPVELTRPESDVIRTSLGRQLDFAKRYANFFYRSATLTDVADGIKQWPSDTDTAKVLSALYSRTLRLFRSSVVLIELGDAEHVHVLSRIQFELLQQILFVTEPNFSMTLQDKPESKTYQILDQVYDQVEAGNPSLDAVKPHEATQSLDHRIRANLLDAHWALAPVHRFVRENNSTKQARTTEDSELISKILEETESRIGRRWLYVLLRNQNSFLGIGREAWTSLFNLEAWHSDIWRAQSRTIHAEDPENFLSVSTVEETAYFDPVLVSPEDIVRASLHCSCRLFLANLIAFHTHVGIGGPAQHMLCDVNEQLESVFG